MMAEPQVADDLNNVSIIYELTKACVTYAYRSSVLVIENILSLPG